MGPSGLEATAGILHSQAAVPALAAVLPDCGNCPVDRLSKLHLPDKLIHSAHPHSDRITMLRVDLLYSTQHTRAVPRRSAIENQIA